MNPRSYSFVLILLSLLYLCAQGKEIVIFTADVPDKQVLIDGLLPGVEYQVLEVDNGLREIATLRENERAASTNLT